MEEMESIHQIGGINNTMIRGYVTNLGKYNESKLIGQWISFPISEDDFQKVLKIIGINEEYEEWFFTDFGLPFDDMNMGEYASIEELNEVAKKLEEVDEDVIIAIEETYTSNLTECFEIYDKEDYIFYAGMTMAEVAQEYAEEQVGCIVRDPQARDWVLRYFDYEQLERDLSFKMSEASTGVIQIF